MVFWSATGVGCLTGRRALVGAAGLTRLVGAAGLTRSSAPLIRSANRAHETGVALRLPLPRQSMPPRLIATVPIRAAPSRTSNSTSTFPTSIGEETLKLIFFAAMPRTVRQESLHRTNRHTPQHEGTSLTFPPAAPDEWLFAPVPRHSTGPQQVPQRGPGPRRIAARDVQRSQQRGATQDAWSRARGTSRIGSQTSAQFDGPPPRASGRRARGATTER